MLHRRACTKARRKTPLWRSQSTLPPRGRKVSAVIHSHPCTDAALSAAFSITLFVSFVIRCPCLLLLCRVVHWVGSSCLSLQMAQEEGLLPLSLRDSRHSDFTVMVRSLTGTVMDFIMRKKVQLRSDIKLAKKTDGLREFLQKNPHKTKRPPKTPKSVFTSGYQTHLVMVTWGLCQSLAAERRKKSGCWLAKSLLANPLFHASFTHEAKAIPVCPSLQQVPGRLCFPYGLLQISENHSPWLLTPSWSTGHPWSGSRQPHAWPDGGSTLLVSVGSWLHQSKGSLSCPLPTLPKLQGSCPRGFVCRWDSPPCDQTLGCWWLLCRRTPATEAVHTETGGVCCSASPVEREQGYSQAQKDWLHEAELWGMHLHTFPKSATDHCHKGAQCQITPYQKAQMVKSEHWHRFIQ